MINDAVADADSSVVILLYPSRSASVNEGYMPILLGAPIKNPT
jgi:hypothetical protein